MKSFKTIICGLAVLLAGVFSVSCEKDEMGKPVEPTLDIAEVVEVDAAGGKIEIPLVSSYPWYASSNADWITMVKYRGQMKLKEKIIIDVKANTTGSVREAGLQVKLMDQLTVDIVIRQKAD